MVNGIFSVLVGTQYYVDQ